MRNIVIFCLLFSIKCLAARENIDKFHYVLYINSYGVTYSWGDSVAKGVIQTFGERKDIILYVENLDSKRFGNSNNELNYQLFKSKYRNVPIEAVVLSDNDAFDFFQKYGNEILPNVPVYFCGINNPEDYHLENTRYYGIKEGVDLDSVNRLIMKIMPNAKKLYFFADSTTTSLINLKFLKKIEPKYKNQIKFEYITNISIDSLKKLVPTFEPGNAIALVDIFQDADKTAVNSDVVLQELASISPIPIFMDAMPSLGKGLCGGIINNGSTQGREAAKLALKFIDDTTFMPANRVIIMPDQYYFDYKILTKYQIDTALLPKGSIIINVPESNFKEYVKYTIALMVVVIFLISIIVLLGLNIKRRKEAEAIVKQKLIEIQDQYTQLEETNQLVKEMNITLGAVNNDLIETNKALIKEKQKSEESDRLKSAFLANMSHEIRTPLNAIVGFSHLICEDINTKFRNDYFRIINNNSDILLVLINDILDISMIESNQLKINQEAFDPLPILNELQSIFQIKAQNKIEIKLLNNNDINAWINTDPVRFRQIITNLLDNATKFTENGYIHFGYSIDKNQIVFFVKDTGIGIPKEEHENIFNYFHKLENSTQKLYRGTGIGLSLCKKLSQLMGGDIWVESEVGKGSVFYFALPFYQKGIKKKPEKVDYLESSIVTTSVIIAEDEDTNYLLIEKYLSLLNIPIKFHAKNGLELTNYIKTHHPQGHCLILMDIKMPVMNGIDALHIVRKINPEIKVIAVTAYATEIEKDNIIKQGFDGYVSKPISRDRLRLIIEKSLGNNPNN